MERTLFPITGNSKVMTMQDFGQAEMDKQLKFDAWQKDLNQVNEKLHQALKYLKSSNNITNGDKRSSQEMILEAKRKQVTDSRAEVSKEGDSNRNKALALAFEKETVELTSFEGKYQIRAYHRHFITKMRALSGLNEEAVDLNEFIFHQAVRHILDTIAVDEALSEVLDLVLDECDQGRHGMLVTNVMSKMTQVDQYMIYSPLLMAIQIPQQTLPRLFAYLSTVGKVDKEESRRTFSLKLYHLSEKVDPVATFKMGNDEILGPNPEYWQTVKTMHREAVETFSFVEVCEILSKRNTRVKTLPGDSVFTKMAVCRVLDIRSNAKKLLEISTIIDKLTMHVDGHILITVEQLTSLLEDALESGDEAANVLITDEFAQEFLDIMKGAHFAYAAKGHTLTSTLGSTRRNPAAAEDDQALLDAMAIKINGGGRETSDVFKLFPQRRFDALCSRFNSRKICETMFDTESSDCTCWRDHDKIPNTMYLAVIIAARIVENDKTIQISKPDGVEVVQKDGEKFFEHDTNCRGT